MKNPVERRIETITQFWNEFGDDPLARLCRWIVDVDGMRLVDVFLELQNEEASEIPDLFVRFPVPFTDAQSYGFELRAWLLKEYEEIRADIQEDEDVPSDWIPPDVSEASGDIANFLRCCASFQKYYGELMEHLVVVLQPEQMGDEEGWQAWLGNLLKQDIPDEVRFLLVEESRAVRLNDLAKEHGKKTMTHKLPLDPSSMYSELLRLIPGTGPGFSFRRHFVTLATAVGIGNLAAARHAAEHALLIATSQNWPELQTVVHMTMGAAHMAQGDARQTLTAYRAAQTALAGQDGATSRNLFVQTRMAEAAALIEQEQWQEAAQVYESAAPTAHEVDDEFAHLECWRMSAYCHEVSEQYDDAWRCGQEALKLGEALDEEARAQTTLNEAAKSMLRVVRQPDSQYRRQGLVEQLESLFGPDWEQQLVQEATTS